MTGPTFGEVFLRKCNDNGVVNHSCAVCIYRSNATWCGFAAKRAPNICDNVSKSTQKFEERSRNNRANFAASSKHSPNFRGLFGDLQRVCERRARL